MRHRAVPYEEMRDRLAATGMPVAFAELLAGMDVEIADGSEDRVSSAVERLTGRPPRSFADFAAAHAPGPGPSPGAATTPRGAVGRERRT